MDSDKPKESIPLAPPKKRFHKKPIEKLSPLERKYREAVFEIVRLRHTLAERDQEIIRLSVVLTGRLEPYAQTPQARPEEHLSAVAEIIHERADDGNLHNTGS